MRNYKKEILAAIKPQVYSAAFFLKKNIYSYPKPIIIPLTKTLADIPISIPKLLNLIKVKLPRPNPNVAVSST